MTTPSSFRSRSRISLLLSIVIFGLLMSGCGLFGSDDDPPEPIDPSEWRDDWNIDTFGGEPKSELYYSISSDEIEIFEDKECPAGVVIISSVENNTIAGEFESTGERVELRIEDASDEKLVFTVLDSPSEGEIGDEVIGTSMNESPEDVAAGCTNSSNTQHRSLGISLGQ